MFMNEKAGKKEHGIFTAVYLDRIVFIGTIDWWLCRQFDNCSASILADGRSKKDIHVYINSPEEVFQTEWPYTTP